MAHIVVEVGAAFSIFSVGEMLISPAEYTLSESITDGTFCGHDNHCGTSLSGRVGGINRCSTGGCLMSSAFLLG